MAETIRVARPHELARMRMDDNLTFFEDAMGSCERILRCALGGARGGALRSAQLAEQQQLAFQRLLAGTAAAHTSSCCLCC